MSWMADVIPDWIEKWEWWPYLAPILLSGIFNLIVAYQKLYRDFRSPFFKPWLSIGFWLWVLGQLALPAIAFCLFAKISPKTTVDFSLYTTAILVGFFFTVFVNADVDLGFTGFPIDKFYAFFNDIAEQQIANEQTALLADFRADFKKDLARNPDEINQGLDWLKDYFESDRNLQKSPSDLSDLLAEVDRATGQPSNDEKIKASLTLILRVRPKDCPQACQKFGCSQVFMKNYFSSRSK